MTPERHQCMCTPMWFQLYRYVPQSICLPLGNPQILTKQRGFTPTIPIETAMLRIIRKSNVSQIQTHHKTSSDPACIPPCVHST
ncbi:hypothetical protein K449DRAFT_49024 [Hypoxylon sp. EC38]|nr:hypothetical protein K449DRAFT_49024 [Hypoxylon sp. EC38]